MKLGTIMIYRKALVNRVFTSLDVEKGPFN